MNGTERYTIGELAALAATTTRTLRHHEDTGRLSPERDANGYRDTALQMPGACGEGATGFLVSALKANLQRARKRASSAVPAA